MIEKNLCARKVEILKKFDKALHYVAVATSAYNFSTCSHLGRALSFSSQML